MTDNNFNSEEINLQLQPLPAYIDSNGAFKLNTPMLSSYDFDGSIPKITGLVNAGNIKPGYLIQLTVGGEYFPVTSIEKEDPILEDSPTGIITINYLNNQGTTIAVQYNETDSITAVYEDWDNKIVGNRGWGITSGGNAIFANVGVRGEIEATTMDIGGETGITYDGSTVIIGASVVVNAPITFNGVTPESLSASLAGYIPDGTAALDIITNQTTITGGNISTGKIKSGGYSGPGTGSAFSTAGMLINLDDGGIASKNFRIDPSGNAFFQGNITAKSGYFGNSTYGMSIVDDGSTVSIRSTTLRIGSQLSNGNLHGAINFYTVGGSAIGAMNSAASDKYWSSLGDGIILGTALDYLFIPSASNTTRSQYRGSGFEWKNTSDSVIMSITGGTGGLKVFTGDISLTGGGNYKLNGSNLSTGTSDVLSTSGPSSPSSYADKTVWYVY